MAVPKKKTSKAKGRSRRASAWPLGQSARSVCPRCGSIKRPHRICSNLVGTLGDRLLTLTENCEITHGFTKRLIKG